MSASPSQVHGALVDVLGVGVLLRGKSGVGKSETALELVTRGHKLVADDVVKLRVDATGRLWGWGPELIRHHVEIRGIGILDLPDLFGADSVIAESPIDLDCQLEEWRADQSYERVGIERPMVALAGVDIPSLTLPARPHMATLVEVAVRDHLQRLTAGSAAERLDRRLAERGRREIS